MQRKHGAWGFDSVRAGISREALTSLVGYELRFLRTVLCVLKTMVKQPLYTHCHFLPFRLMTDFPEYLPVSGDNRCLVILS